MKHTRPPGPSGDPLIGFFRHFRRDPIRVLKLASQYGPVAWVRVATQEIWILNDPDLVKEVLVTQASKFRKSRILQRAKMFLGEGLLTSEGEFHLRQRRLAQPAFHRERLMGYGEVMAKLSVAHRDRWRGGECRDVDADMMRLTLAIVGQTLFSADVEGAAPEVGQAMTDLVGSFNFAMLPFGNLLQRLPIPAAERLRKARAVIDAVIYKLIAERRQNGEDRGDLLSMLLMAQDAEGGTGGMDDTQVRDEAVTLFLAGHETTANALTWAMYLLSENPEVERQLHAELDSVLGGAAPETRHLPNLRVTEGVFAESMRLYPPAWAIGRMATDTVALGGYEMPAGAIAVSSPYMLHRDERYWPEPEKMDPARWTPELRESRPKFSYLPFGAGARICIGERFAWMEGVLALAAIAQRWQMRLEPGHPVEVLPQITLRPKHGMRMRVTERTGFGQPVAA
jgi:cytochrome P450